MSLARIILMAAPLSFSGRLREWGLSWEFSICLSPPRTLVFFCISLCPGGWQLSTATKSFLSPGFLLGLANDVLVGGESIYQSSLLLSASWGPPEAATFLLGTVLQFPEIFCHCCLHGLRNFYSFCFLKPGSRAWGYNSVVVNP